MVLTCGNLPAKVAMPRSLHTNAGYARSVAGGSGKLGFSKAIAEAPYRNKKAKISNRYNPFHKFVVLPDQLDWFD